MRQLYRSSILFLVVCVLSLFSQDATIPRYWVYKETSLTSASEAVTVQQPSTGAKNVYFTDAGIYCSVACVATIEKDGTAATTTALAVISLQDSAPTASLKAFSSSNAGTGTVINKINVSAGNLQPLDLAGMGLTGNDTTKNFTIRTDSITGTVRIYYKWLER